MSAVETLDYNYLLERAYSMLPKRTKKAHRFILPKVNAITIGSYTTIRNFKEIYDTLRRNPKHLSRFLLRKIGVAGSIDESSGSLTLHGRVSASTLNRLLEIYVKKYVVCPTCGSWDTVLERKGRVWLLRCEACGAETSVEHV